MFQYEAEIKRVIDGDTLELLVDLGFSVHTLAVVRLAHVNAPDTLNMGAGGIEEPAKEFILERCAPGAVVVVFISRKEKYGRWLADVFYLRGSRDRNAIVAQGANLNQELLVAGLVQPYEGGKK